MHQISVSRHTGVASLLGRQRVVTAYVPMFDACSWELVFPLIGTTSHWFVSKLFAMVLHSNYALCAVCATVSNTNW